eukprot:732424-Amphidinium_carterae.1
MTVNFCRTTFAQIRHADLNLNILAHTLPSRKSLALRPVIIASSSLPTMNLCFATPSSIQRVSLVMCIFTCFSPVKSDMGGTLVVDRLAGTGCSKL